MGREIGLSVLNFAESIKMAGDWAKNFAGKRMRAPVERLTHGQSAESDA
jgi:hypothetical protein